MSLKDIQKNREEMEAAKEERLAEMLKPKLEAPVSPIVHLQHCDGFSLCS
jgi:hypothetical protein